MRMLLAAAAFMAVTGFTPHSNCSDEFLSGQAPANVNSRYAAHAQSLCYSQYAVLESADTLTPLWSAEHLTRSEVNAARSLKRVDRFHAEPSLPESARAELADYVRSGYDRGHMTPSGDMASEQAQQESFTLANMAPQLPSLNRGLWEEIESTTRNLAVRDGDVYIVTGPMFAANAQKLNNRVDIPAAFYKAVYDPQGGVIGAYVAWNAEDSRMRTVTIAQLRDALGFDPFPALSESVKQKSANLPAPTRASGGV